MAKPLYELVQDNLGRDLTESYIQDVFDMMISEELDLIPYIEDFRITGQDGKHLGNYLRETHCIKIHKPAIEHSKTCDPHLLTLEVVKHEMEHARNLRTAEMSKDDIESYLVKCGLRYYTMKHGIDTLLNVDELYPRFLEMDTIANYNLNPEERIARIKAWRYVVNLLKNNRGSEELKTAREKLYKAYRRGYRDNRYYLEAPALHFLINTGMLHEHRYLIDRLHQKNYSFDTRIMYGLPVRKEEYEEKILQKVKPEILKVDE